MLAVHSAQLQLFLGRYVAVEADVLLAHAEGETRELLPAKGIAERRPPYSLSPAVKHLSHVNERRIWYSVSRWAAVWPAPSMIRTIFWMLMS